MINLINLEIEKDNVWIIIKPKTNKGISKAKEAYKRLWECLNCFAIKFIYSEKATKFWKISLFLLSYVVPVKSKMDISQNFVAFS